MITKKRNKLFSLQVEKEDDPEKNPKINLDFLKEAEEDKKMQSKQQKNAKVCKTRQTLKFLTTTEVK